MSAPVLRFTLLTLTALIGVGCGGSKSSSGSTATPVGSGSTTAVTTSGTATTSPGTTTPGTTTPGTTTPGTTTPPATTFPAAPPTGEQTGVYLGRSYRMYVPTNYTPTRAWPVMVMFHGSGDTAQNFMTVLRGTGWHTAAESEGAVLIVPDTKSPYRTFPIWTGDPLADVPQSRVEMAEILQLVTAEVGATYNLGKLHAFGFSDGGLFIAVAGLEEAAFSTHTVFGYGWGRAYVNAPARKGPVHFACGDADRFYPNADATRTFLDGQGHEVRWDPIPGVGHSVSGLTGAIGARSTIAWALAR